MRVLGLDVGDKRIGVAVSDPLRIVASPLEVYERRGGARDLDYIAALAETYGADTVVIGLPLKMEGGDSEQTKKTREFAAALAGRTAAKLIFTDERCTTSAAEEALLEANLPREERKKLIDKVAAAILLQDYLNSPPDKRRAEG